MLSPKTIKSSAEVKADGLYRLSNEAYHAGQGISSSNLKDILRSPAHYKAAKQDKKTTPAMEFGTLVHTMLLEPELFDRDYAVEPELDGPKTKKPWKDIWDEFKKEVQGRKIVKTEDYDKARMMCKAARAHTYASYIMECCDTEVSAYFRHDGTFLKARADLIDYENGFIWDVKTTQDARESEFTKSIGNFKYHLSAAYYLDVFTRATGKVFDKFGWIVMEKTAPFSVATYIADPYALEVGRMECQKALQTYSECIVSGNWPGYKESIDTIGLPKYYNAEN